MLDRVEHCTEFSFLALSCAPFPLTFGRSPDTISRSLSPVGGVFWNTKNFHARTPVCPAMTFERTHQQHESTAITSLAEPSRNVFALSLNKTYKKYCWCRGQAPSGDRHEILRNEFRAENYLQFSYVLLKIIILYYSTRLMGSIRRGGRGHKTSWRLHLNFSDCYHFQSRMITRFSPPPSKSPITVTLPY